MPQPRSDSRQENHPKSVQAGSRKIVGGVEVDYDDFADVIANTNAFFRPNKFYWVAGVYYQVDSDGITFRVVGGAGGAGIKYLKFAINSDGTGEPDSTFDGYKAEGVLLSDSRLESVRIITVIVGTGGALQDFFAAAPNKVNYTSTTGQGTLDFTNTVSGRLYAPDTVIVIYQPL